VKNPCKSYVEKPGTWQIPYRNHGYVNPQDNFLNPEMAPSTNPGHIPQNSVPFL
jgi:hypothetical protein